MVSAAVEIFDNFVVVFFGFAVPKDSIFGNAGQLILNKRRCLEIHVGNPKREKTVWIFTWLYNTAFNSKIVFDRVGMATLNNGIKV